MKILIVSDIHGAKDSAVKIAELDQKHDFEKIICLGDINYHGPRNPLPADYDPKAVISVLNALKDKIIAVKGNCDADVDQMMYDFSLCDYLRMIAIEDRILWLTHGHVYDETHLPPLSHDDIFMYGHTHLPICKYEDGHYTFNPGSITLPKGGHPRTYGLMDHDGLAIYDLNDELYQKTAFKKRS